MAHPPWTARNENWVRYTQDSQSHLVRTSQIPWPYEVVCAWSSHALPHVSSTAVPPPRADWGRSSMPQPPPVIWSAWCPSSPLYILQNYKSMQACSPLPHLHPISPTRKKRPVLMWERWMLIFVVVNCQIPILSAQGAFSFKKILRKNNMHPIFPYSSNPSYSQNTIHLRYSILPTVFFREIFSNLNTPSTVINFNAQ